MWVVVGWGGGGGCQSLERDWVFLKVMLNVTVIIWHMRPQQNKTPELKLFQSCNFEHKPRGQ